MAPASAQSKTVRDYVQAVFDPPYNSYPTTYGQAVLADGAGNVYVAGQEDPATTGGTEGFVTKFDDSLRPVTRATFRGSGNYEDGANGLAFGHNSDLFVAGYQTLVSMSGPRVGWIGRYDLSLNLISSATFGATGTNNAYGVAVDASGNVWVAGQLYSAATHGDAFVAEYSPTLALISSATFSSTGAYDDTAYGIAVDASGAVWVSGQMSTGTSKTTAWVARLTGDTLAVMSSTTLQVPAFGSADNAARSIAIGPDGNGYVAGWVYGIPTGYENIWVAKYSPAMVVLSSVAIHAYGTYEPAEAMGIAVDAANDVFVTGWVTPGVEVHQWTGLFDANLNLSTAAEISPLAANQNQGRALSYDGKGNLYVTGVVTAADYRYSGWLSKHALNGPAPATGLAGVGQSTSSILWTWTNDPQTTASGYRVIFASNNFNLSGDLPAGTTFWVQTGLKPNSLSGKLLVQAFGASGASNSAWATRHTLPAVPKNLHVTAVSSSTVSLAWDANGNDPSTIYIANYAQGSPDGYCLVNQSPPTANPTHITTNSVTQALLSWGTTYFYRVQAMGNDGGASDYSSVVSTVTVTPLAKEPYMDGWMALSTSSIKWNWLDNSGGLAQYRLMHGATNISGNLPAGTTYWVETGLGPNEAVEKFFLRLSLPRTPMIFAWVGRLSAQRQV